jgi:hypothetical protein
MINRATFESQWIRTFNEKPQKANPQIIEKEIHALQLLEFLSQTQLHFIFKGGTCLSLILQQFTRFSVDIDIITNENIDAVKSAIEFIDSQNFFIRVEENSRDTISKIEKKHFKFFYNSVIANKEDYVLLDIVFETSSYKNIQKSKVDFLLLQSSEPYYFVNTPSLEELLMDKLTAFAPNTIGITYESEKYTEIIKQMYDVSIISKSLGHNRYPIDTYIEMADKQISWRELKLTYRGALKDSITTCLNILTSGAYDKEKYDLLERSMRGFNGYVYGNRFNSIDLQICVIDALRTATIVYVGGIVAYTAVKKMDIDIRLIPEFKAHYKVLRGELSRSGYFDILVETLSVVIDSNIL